MLLAQPRRDLAVLKHLDSPATHRALLGAKSPKGGGTGAIPRCPAFPSTASWTLQISWFCYAERRQLASAAQIAHGVGMELTLPKPLDERLSRQDAALHLAIGLFVTEEATLGQAAQTAGLSQTDFLRVLGRRRIPIHYGAEELAADLQAVEALTAK